MNSGRTYKKIVLNIKTNLSYGNNYVNGDRLEVI